MTARIDRLKRVQKEMLAAGLDLLVLGPSADMFYFGGVRLPLTERFNALLIPLRGSAAFVVPLLQAPILDSVDRSTFSVVPWGETEDPLDLIKSFAGDPRQIGIGAQLWSTFLLRLQRTFPAALFRDADEVTAGIRLIKDTDEISILEENARRFDSIWEELFATSHLIGATENEVRRRIGELASAHGFDGLAWCDVGSGPNGASPLHHGSDRRIAGGEPVVIDFAAVRQGYFMDTCRTPVAGEPAAEFVAIYDTVNRAYDSAAETIRPGVPAQHVDAAGRRVIADAGHGELFIHRIGHGLGLDGHEAPYIVSGNDDPLREGMVFSNEPGIYVPGKWGVRIENIMLVTGDGARALNNASRDLVTMA